MSCRQDTLGRPRGRPAYRVPGQAARHLRDTLMEADVSPPTLCRYACLLAHLIKLPNHAAGGINIDLKINPRACSVALLFQNFFFFNLLSLSERVHSLPPLLCLLELSFKHFSETIFLLKFPSRSIFFFFEKHFEHLS